MKDLVLIERPDIVAIADAIRAKTGQNGGMTLKQMSNEIEGIQSGSGGPLQACVVSVSEGTGDIWYGEGVYNTVYISMERSITAEDVVKETTE